MENGLKTPYKISLDFYIRKIITVNAKQLDSDSRIINITCTENGKKFFVDSSTTSAFVRYKKSDGFAVLNQVDILADGTVNLELSQQMLAVEGRHLVDIVLINGTELTTETVESILNSDTMDGISVLSTMSFYVNTEGVAIDGAEIESSYEYNALIEGLGKMVAVDNRMSNLEQTINENETKRQTNEEARKTDEINRAQAEQQRQNNTQQAIQNCNTATSNANTATENANNATKDAQTATANANAATNNANQATQNANTATENANNAAQETRDVLYNGGMVLKSDIVHDLETEDETKVPDATQVKRLKDKIDDIDKFIAEISLPDSASTHNAIFRGEDLTSKYTVDQICERIAVGTFEDLYIGDYFDITFTNPQTSSQETMRCILAAFDYYYNQQTDGCNKHHAVIIPKNCVGGYYSMNSNYENHPTEGGYIGSEMFTTTLQSFVTPLQTALNNHIITHKNILASAVNADGNSAAGAGMVGYASSYTWKDVTITIPNEIQVYGTQVWSSSPYNVGLDTTILPLFAHNPMARVCGIQGVADGGEDGKSYWYWWLRDVVSATDFACVMYEGIPFSYYAYVVNRVGFRPLFLIG